VVTIDATAAQGSGFAIGVAGGTWVATRSNLCSTMLLIMRTWEAHDPDFNRPIAAPLERCAELLGVDIASVREAAAGVEPYIRSDGTKVWSLMQLERQLHPEAFGRVRGGYISRRRVGSQVRERIPPG
jgi:hypothetical protein